MYKLSYIIISLLLLQLSGLPAAFAQDPAEFERLFTSKRLRNNLDQARANYDFSRPQPVITQQDNSEDYIAPDMVLNGFISRADGSTDIWINNQRASGKQADNQESFEAKRMRDNKVQVKLQSGAVVLLKPGQLYLPSSEQVKEVYQRAIAVPLAVEPELLDDTETSPEADSIDAKSDETSEEFDEASLGEQDFRIKLLEERIKRLETSKGAK